MTRTFAWLAGLICLLAVAGCGGSETSGGSAGQAAILDQPVFAANADQLRASIDRVTEQGDLATSMAFQQALSVVAAEANGALEGIARLDVPQEQKQILARTALRAHYRICMDEGTPGFLAAVAGKSPRQIIALAGELKRRYGGTWED